MDERTVRWTRRRAVPLLWLLAAATASAAPKPPSSSLESTESGARALAVTDDSGSRQTPFAGFTAFESIKKDWTVVTFYLMFREAADGEARRRETYWAARRVTGSDARAARVHPETTWASSEKCPALDAAIRSMGDVVADRLELGVPGEGEPSEVEADPTHYRLWTEQGRFRGTAFAASLSVSSVAESPVAVWVQSSSATLESCWTGTAPAGATVPSP
jgi:hypothetical protein